MKFNEKKKKYEFPVATDSPIINAIINSISSDNDPNGSYTGRPLDPYETPVQDADDL